MRRALSVVVSDGRVHRTMTKYAERVRFAKQAPGGFFDASFTLNAPRRTFTDLGPADRCFLYDARTGYCAWDGYTKNPTPKIGAVGESWDVTAVGGSVVASDESRALIYIDRSLDRWTRGTLAVPSATTGSGPDPDGLIGDGVFNQFNPGQPVRPGSRALTAYYALRMAGMEFGALYCVTKAGLVSSDYRMQMRYGDNIPGGLYGFLPMHQSTQVSQTPIVNNRFVGDNPTVNPPAGTVQIDLGLTRTGPEGNVNLETIWGLWSDVAILGRRMDRNGALLTGEAGMISNRYVMAQWVVEDLLGRVLRMCDPTTAVVESGSAQITQLAYPDGVKASQVLDDLVNLYEPDMDWGIGRTLPNGLHEFWWRYWPTTPRYLLGSDVDVEQKGSDVDLANRVLVTWTDINGQPITQAFGREVVALGAGSPVLPDGSPNPVFTGRVCDAEPVTLPDGSGSADDAALIADHVLRRTSGEVPPSAVATFDCRVFDRLRNMWIEPHELDPGHVARVVRTGQDLRVTNSDYDDDSGVASLDLGVPVLSTAQRVQQIVNARPS